MRNLLARLLLVVLCLGAAPAFAQSTGTVVGDCSVGPGQAYTQGGTRQPTINTIGQNCITGSITASLAAFHPEASLTPITATTGGVSSSAFTAGKGVLVQNAGTTNAAYCAPGASASTSSQYIPAGGTALIQTTSETQITCVTSTSTTTVNMQTGTGLWAGAGAGSGSSGGGGAITAASGSYASGALSSGSIASGAVASGAVSSGAYAAGALAAGAFAAGAGVDGWDLTQGAKADAAWTTGSGSVISLLKAIAAAEIVTNRAVNVAQWGGNAITCTITAYGTAPTGNCPGFNVFVTNTNANGQATAANSSPVVLPAAQVTVDPCSLNNKTNLAVSFTATASAQLIALSGSTKIYVCSVVLIGSVATNFSLTGGTGTNCGTPAALIGTTSATNAIPLAANGGFSLGNGAGTVAVTGAGSELCIVQSGAGNIVGNLTYVQQ